MNRSRKIIGVPWFTPETYGPCRFQMADKEDLPLDFRAWQESADERIAEIEEAGQIALRCGSIPPVSRSGVASGAWCRMRAPVSAMRTFMPFTRPSLENDAPPLRKFR